MNQMKKIDREITVDAPDDIAAETVVVTRRNPKRIILMLGVPLLILLVGGYYWLNSGKDVATDNAYVKQDVTSISAQVSGPIAEVGVRESQRVKRGDILYRIDPAPFEVAVMQAEAQLAAAQLQTHQLEVQSAGTGGDIIGAQANLAIAQRALVRQNELLRQGFTTRSAHDDAYNEVQKGQMQLSDARARASSAQAAIAPGGNQPQIAAARATLAKAKLDLSHTTIRAPFDAVVANSSRLLVGQTVVTGLTMLSLVKDQAAWVEANYKEDDLSRMHVGQPATVTFDAYPGLKMQGHVQSIGAGTGSEFSVLPAQNANGNWVKVTQRIPVRIFFDSKPPREMIAGLSAKVVVTLDPRK